MSLWKLIFRSRKPTEATESSEPAQIDVMPARPYRVVHADLPFYSDSNCEREVEGARLVVLTCQDPFQKQQTIECMPVVKRYREGQLVSWDLNNKRMWETAWYRNPGSGEIQKAWSQAVEFNGKVVTLTPATPAEPNHPKIAKRA